MLAASLTLLPAILGFVGTQHRPAAGAVHRPRRRTRATRPSGTAGAGWSSTGRGSPSSAAPLVLLVITLPVLSLRLGFPDDGNNLPSRDVPAGLRPADHRLRPRLQRPAAAGRRPQGRGRPRRPPSTRLSDGRRRPPRAWPSWPRRCSNPAGDTAIINVFPDDQAPGRGHVRPRAPAARHGDPGRGRRHRAPRCSSAASPPSPSTRATTSPSGCRSSSASVVLLSFLLLTTVFRSPLVALKAGIMNLLSIAAAYGVMSYAVQGNVARRPAQHPRDARSRRSSP